MFMVDYYSDAILVYTLKSITRTELLRAVTKLYENLKARGLQLPLYMINNVCSALMNNFIREAGATLQLLPPGLYRYVVVEREIQKFKAHLIAGLSSCDPNSPLHL